MNVDFTTVFLLVQKASSPDTGWKGKFDGVMQASSKQGRGVIVFTDRKMAQHAADRHSATLLVCHDAVEFSEFLTHATSLGLTHVIVNPGSATGKAKVTEIEHVVSVLNGRFDSNEDLDPE
jgi:hypothetical protein